ncbi:tetraacyldisaccharide 4'-kinase [Christiangramia fulva]|uniref:Tetraacyldisaccharide 4'-kinase n=1 Tax=Christiangramia fulva TaxID=2126553 RepID=A0A2R3Z1A8_9FLAO|nr:tetraacyldisaccharide 4'-kinase [Christiangramia fulva]AVR44046.1 tetraacyldisaccharide 4'-kinase [Christiangramia fulva]
MFNPRKLLYPFSLLYGGVTAVRNYLYDHSFLKSQEYSLPLITIGNLSVGGTGKSPMTEYLLNLLHKNYKLATLSRGYKRSSKGFQLVEVNDEVSKSGDEPLQFKNKFPDMLVAVDANRRKGIEKLLKFHPDVIILDDAFQHRKVKGGFQILLTAYGDLYKKDLVLPAGNLREPKTGASRADMIVVTKCPQNLSEEEMLEITDLLKPEVHQKIYFSYINYSEEIISEKEKMKLAEIDSSFTLVTGISNPKPLLDHLHSKNIHLKHLKFPDHHNFSEKEIEILNTKRSILTTEKDYMRLRKRLDTDKLFYLPIEISFLKEGNNFDRRILDFIQKK